MHHDTDANRLRFMPNYSRLARTISLVATVLITGNGCDWVDSTGVQGSEGTAIDDTAPRSLRNAEAFPIIEQSPMTAPLEGEGAQLRNWTWTLQGTDELNRCDAVNGFNNQYAAQSLSDACGNSGECNVAIDESSDENSTRFTIQLPPLRAPVALDYLLTSIRDDGAQIQRQQILCAISVNEAPLVKNVHYISITEQPLIVNGSDGNSLLAEVEDDVDAQNQPLRILQAPVTPPRYAIQFTLDGDGGFIYQANSDALINESGTLQDSFVYAVTDGLHTVEGTATIEIVASNREPRQLRSVPDFEFIANNNTSTAQVNRVDLSDYFIDPDGDPLTFTIDAQQLPASGNVSVSSNGELRISATLADIGSWPVDVFVSDGIGQISDRFTLTIDSEPAPIDTPNESPTATDIPNTIVQDNFSYDVSRYFEDPDGDKLLFSASGLPDGVSISNSGLISGVSDDNNEGRWFISVTASDSLGGSVTDSFRLIIR